MTQEGKLSFKMAISQVRLKIDLSWFICLQSKIFSLFSQLNNFVLLIQMRYDWTRILMKFSCVFARQIYFEIADRDKQFKIHKIVLTRLFVFVHPFFFNAKIYLFFFNLRSGVASCSCNIHIIMKFKHLLVYKFFRIFFNFVITQIHLFCF